MERAPKMERHISVTSMGNTGAQEVIACTTWYLIFGMVSMVMVAGVVAPDVLQTTDLSANSQ